MAVDTSLLPNDERYRGHCTWIQGNSCREIHGCGWLDTRVCPCALRWPDPVKLLTQTLSTQHWFPQVDGSSPPLEHPYLFPESFGPTIKGPRKSKLWSQAACRIWTKDDGYSWKLLDPVYMSLMNTPMFTLLVCKSPPMARREPGPLMESHVLHSEVDFCLRLGPPQWTIPLL